MFEHNNQYQQMLYFDILKNNEVYLALDINLCNNHILYSDLALQNFIVVGRNYRANNVKEAIERFKDWEKVEFNKLNTYIKELEGRNNNLRTENSNLHQKILELHSTPNIINKKDFYLQLFDFGTLPTKEELKTRYKELSQLIHPDKKGDTKLFQLINEANTFLETLCN